MAHSTKRLLADSLLKLLESKSLSEITVKELVEVSGVNRQTFYYNFHDIYALLEWIFTEQAKQLLSENTNQGDWQRGLMAVLDYMRQNRRVILNAVGPLNRGAVERFLKTCLYGFIKPIIQTKAQGTHVSEEDLEFVIQLYTLGYIGIVFDWMYNGMPGNSSSLDKFIRLVDGSTAYVLAKMETP